MASLLQRLMPLVQHPVGFTDILVLFAGYYITILGLVTPSTRGYRLLRAAIIPPITSGLYAYYAYYALQPSYADQWGVTIFMAFFAIKSFEFHLFFPAEAYNFRVRPEPERINEYQETSLTANGSLLNGAEKRTNGTSNGHSREILVAEPVPPPWTLAKFWWASSLFWSFRGIGWNFAAPLPASSLQDPYTRTSSRLSFFLHRGTLFALEWVILDVLRSYMNLSSAAAFFGGKAGAPAYHDLSQWQRGVYSLCFAARVCLGMDRSFIPMSLIFVGIGGITGWKGEIWEPWGWPPLFASLEDLWKYPGLSHLWSKEWRRWLYLFGWKGIGETILRLPPSGPSPRLPRLHVDDQASPTPVTSGESSPAHPIHFGKPHTLAQERSQKAPIQLSNLIKSLCVFTLTGLMHDIGSFVLPLYNGRRAHGAPIVWSDVLVTTTFFVAQPFALAFEEIVKSLWRRWKRQRGEERGKWETVERAVAFAWTWIFIGWSAQWFVIGLSKIGYYQRDASQDVFPSVIGGLLWDVWEH